MRCQLQKGSTQLIIGQKRIGKDAAFQIESKIGRFPVAGVPVALSPTLIRWLAAGYGTHATIWQGDWKKEHFTDNDFPSYDNDEGDLEQN